MRVLLVEDDEAIANLLHHSLTAQHYLVEVAADGQAGWDLAEAFEYDLILLDLKLPKLDGISFCQRLRHEGHYRSKSSNRDTPILLMTAEDASNNRVAGLDAGADDYIVKPFDLDELLARVRALLRRGRVGRSPLLEWGPLQLDPSACQASCKGQPFHLSAKEYSLLELLLRHPQRIFSQGTLIEHLWTLEQIPTENAVRAQIKGLRKKLKDVGIEDCIETVYGLGYRLKEARVETAKTAEAAEKASPPDLPIRALWQQYQAQYSDRLFVIEQAVSALHSKTLTEELRQQAQREAHTLKGSLGLFGLDDASELSHQIEQLLKVKDRLQQDQQAQFVELILRLRQVIAQPFSEITPTPEGTSAVEPIAVINSTIPPQKRLLPQESQLFIVDDDSQLLDLLQATLQPWGFQVALLNDPQSFWCILETVNPDLLMLDIEMPEVNGIDLCQEIRNHPRWQDLPILMISANTDDETIQQVFMAGADDYVSKPIRAAELVARVTRRLEHANVLKRLRCLKDNSQC